MVRALSSLGADPASGASLMTVSADVVPAAIVRGLGCELVGVSVFIDRAWISARMRSPKSEVDALMTGHTGLANELFRDDRGVEVATIPSHAEVGAGQALRDVALDVGGSGINMASEFT